MPHNIYLTGMMGSGKTVTGKALAILLRCGFVDLDETIQERARKTISEIFEKEGEEYFREQESLILKEVSAVNPRVVATGGGTVLRPLNVKQMWETGKIVYLETSLEVLWERVKEKKDRPLLQDPSPKEKLREIFFVRKPIYEQVCDLRINTDQQSPDVVARHIYEQLGHLP
jgi:shikimate kinase